MLAASTAAAAFLGHAWERAAAAARWLVWLQEVNDLGMRPELAIQQQECFIQYFLVLGSWAVMRISVISA